MNEEQHTEQEVVDSAETTTEELSDNSDSYEEDDSAGEDETTSEAQSSNQSRSETPEQRNARIKRQVEREAKKQGISVEEYLGISRKEGGQETSQVDEKYDRLELKTEGITDTKEQDIVLDYARYKGISVAEAAKKPVVKAEIAELRVKSSTPKPSTRTNGGAATSKEYYIRQIKAGNMRLTDIPDREMRKQVRNSGQF